MAKRIDRFQRLGLSAFLISMGVPFGVLSPYFLTWANITNILIQSAVPIIVATGMTLVIATAGIDKRNDGKEDKKMKEIDCRGMACPQPVITTKKALDEMEMGEFVLIVDNPSARDNVERLVQSQGAKVSIEKKENDFYLHIEKGSACVLAESAQKAEKVVVYINSNLMGVGEEALGAILIRSFLKTLLDLKPVPSKLIFVNAGVRLTIEGSEVLESLKTISEKGAEILSCGTCLDFYGLKEKLRVGVISNMYDIAQSLLDADRLIRP